MQWKFNSISAKLLADVMYFLEKTLSCLHNLSSDPLFSTMVTMSTLVLLYFPGVFVAIVFSPVLILTGILLLTLLRLGAKQRKEKEFDSVEAQQQTNDSEEEDDYEWVSSQTKLEAETEMGLGFDLDRKPLYSDSFLQWSLRAPLEVIYEDYEGEEENDDVDTDREHSRIMGIDRYPSLSLYYPESDTDSSSDGEFPAIIGWELPESMSFVWEEEDRGLIEIALDGKRTSEGFHAEEDNLIEIDISTARIEEFAGEKR